MSEFNTFNEFFTRAVKPRSIDSDESIIVSPSDSKILSISEVKGDANIAVKHTTYKLGEFLTGLRGYKIENHVFESLKQGEDKAKSKIY